MDPISYDRERPSAPPAFDAPFPPTYAPPAPLFSSYSTAPSAPPILCLFCGGPNPSIYRLPCGCSVYAHTPCSSSQGPTMTQCPICRYTFLHFPAPTTMLQQQVQVLQEEQDALARRRVLRGGCCLVLVVVAILVWVIVRYVVHVE